VDHCGAPQHCLPLARYPSVPLLALTATATQRVQRDVVLQLAMAHAVNFRSSFNRANLRRGRAVRADGRSCLLGMQQKVDRGTCSRTLCCRYYSCDLQCRYGAVCNDREAHQEVSQSRREDTLI
jgi:hypothetical protein